MPRVFALLVLLSPFALAQPPAAPNPNAGIEYIRAHYTKYDYRIPMRDGVKLFTSVYVPKDSSKQYPIMMQRTPYSIGPYGVDNYPRNLGPSELFRDEGFIFAYQDVRGRYLSEGKFVDVPSHTPGGVDESTDTYDTIDWLIKKIPNNNGNVGIWGISYPGFYAAFSLIGSHPALKAVSPQAPMGDVGNGDDAYHNGAFYLAANFGFYRFFKPQAEPQRPAPAERFEEPGAADAYEYFLHLGPLAAALKDASIYWQDVLKHPAYDDFWQSKALAPHMRNVKPAVLFVGGWYDAEDLSGPLKLFHSLEKNGPAAPDTLVMGPYSHGSWARAGKGDTLGNLNFGSATGEFYRKEIEFPFFMLHLKAKNIPAYPKAWLFETGTNIWRKFAAWPPADAQPRSLYLDANGKLGFDRAETAGYDEYISDPSRPVPVTGEIGPGMPGDYMTYDQRFASRRPDVLVYQTAPLDHDITIAGPITPSLRVSTSGTDSDFDVKLIDVYPDDFPDPQPNPRNLHMGGYQRLVRGEPFRGKYRNSMAKPEAFQPNAPAKIEFMMPDVCHTFRPSHRIMVQIQSSWFPLTDRNPQQFLNIPTAKAADFHKATERVYFGGSDGSAVRILVLP
jgi:putative CocE/NonD family hydrolase